MVFPIPVNEEARIELIRDLDILEDLSEETYDFVTQVASNVFNTPIALVTIIDEDWQYFKSKVGLEISGTPREQAFCAYNLDGGNLLIIEDATKDERFKDNPLVLGHPNIRFYAGAPIEADDDVYLGSVCIIDSEPRSMTEEEKQILKALGRQVSALLKIKRLSKNLREKTMEIIELQKIVPICSKCGNIKDTRDYWITVEEYLQSHERLQLTQSFCPNCSDELDDNFDMM